MDEPAETTDVDAYLAASAGAARPILKELRQLLTSTIPGVEEKISWGVPFYRYHGALGGFAAYKNHVSFGCASDLSSEDRERLEELGYKTGKKTIQIQFDQEVPTAAIKHILEKQARKNEARQP
jgi:uncharacterized protein